LHSCGKPQKVLTSGLVEILKYYDHYSVEKVDGEQPRIGIFSTTLCARLTEWISKFKISMVDHCTPVRERASVDAANLDLKKYSSSMHVGFAHACAT
jgi:hypothetical protein